MKKRKLFEVLCLMALVFVVGVSALQVDASEFTFAVNTIIPENQLDQDKTYFDLMVEPGQEQVLEVELRNDTDEEVQVEAVIRSATTNINGVVEYGDRDVERDSTLEYAMEDLIEVPEVVTIPANTTYTLEMELTVPEEEFTGVLAGGVTFQEVESEEDEDEEEQSSGMSIQNKYAYVVGIVLQMNEDAVDPELILNDVFAGQVNARNVINANIQNIMPMYMNDMSVEARITKKGQGDTLYELEAENMQMAPNSNFDLPIPLNGEKMEAGEYTLYMTVESMDETWVWERDFTITNEEAEAFNETDVSIPEDTSYLYIIIGALLLILAIIIFFIILSRRKAKKERAEFEAAFQSKD